jgi:hypothetical protein
MVAELIKNGVRESNDKTNGFCIHIGTPRQEFRTQRNDSRQLHTKSQIFHLFYVATKTCILTLAHQTEFL